MIEDKIFDILLKLVLSAFLAMIFSIPFVYFHIVFKIW